MIKDLVIRGAREHNLKGVDLDLPRGRLIVITGPSGSGKSSLAFDTIFAESQRRYVEALSPYARQFLLRLPKPDVDSIEGLSPALSVQQSFGAANPRSTVATATEIHDFLRLLYARAGEPHCPSCGKPIRAHTRAQMVERVMALPAGTRFSVHAPLARKRRGSFRDELARLRTEGFVRVMVDGEVCELGQDLVLDDRRPHDLDVVVDRLSVRDGIRQRLNESLELGLSLGEGVVHIVPRSAPRWAMSERFACADCDRTLPPVTPAGFSFNSPAGACPRCEGIGEVRVFEPELIVPEPSRSLRAGAIAPWGNPDSSAYRRSLKQMTEHIAVDVERPWRELPESVRAQILHGGGGYEGVVSMLQRKHRQYAKRRAEDLEALDFLDEELQRYSEPRPCAACHGARLRAESLAVRVGGKHIAELAAMPLSEVRWFVEALEITGAARDVAERVLPEISRRLSVLLDLGLDYLSLDRSTATLSGGERERIRLATQIGAGLVGVLYVLDEPSIGLHPRDTQRLIGMLEGLRDRGNTVLVVEHDADIMRAADWIVDMGPSAGLKGGHVVARGRPDDIARTPGSPTGPFLSGERQVGGGRSRQRAGKDRLTIEHASVHNLDDLTVSIPLGVLSCVTGVSGSGKSSLVSHTLLPCARHRLHGGAPPRVSARVSGLDELERVVHVDQEPIGRTPRSNPATYSGVFAPIREIFADLPEARARGYRAARFSFNAKGGRCESCQGAGAVRVALHFLPDMYVTCEDCAGQRYNPEILEIAYRGKNIAQVLAMTVDEADEFFSSYGKIRGRLAALRDVGLGYLQLGQRAPTLSGGEAQRLKLARELARRGKGRTLYVLDEPTTGLHFVDIQLLVELLRDLVSQGHTVVVVEHDMDVIKIADHIIDLGPEGGTAGGKLVAEGAPEQVARVSGSHTGRHLARILH